MMLEEQLTPVRIYVNDPDKQEISKKLFLHYVWMPSPLKMLNMQQSRC